jgi:hypothetical protein
MIVETTKEIIEKYMKLNIKDDKSIIILSKYLNQEWVCLDSLKKELDIILPDGNPLLRERKNKILSLVTPKSDWQKGFEEGWVAGRAELIEDSKLALVASKKVKRMEEVEWERKN